MRTLEINSHSESGSYRRLDGTNTSSTRILHRIDDRTLLNPGDIRRHRNNNTRLCHSLAAGILNIATKHVLRHVKVRNNTPLNRTNGTITRRNATNRLECFLAEFIRAVIIFLHQHNRGLIKYNFFTSAYYRFSRSEVNSQISEHGNSNQYFLSYINYITKKILCQFEYFVAAKVAQVTFLAPAR